MNVLIFKLFCKVKFEYMFVSEHQVLEHCFDILCKWESSHKEVSSVVKVRAKGMETLSWFSYIL